MVHGVPPSRYTLQSMEEPLQSRSIFPEGMETLGELVLKQRIFWNKTASHGKASAGARESVKAVTERKHYVRTLVPHPTAGGSQE